MSTTKALYNNWNLKTKIAKAREEQKKDGYIFYVDFVGSNAGFPGTQTEFISIAREYGYRTSGGRDIVEECDRALNFMTRKIKKYGSDLYFGYLEVDGSIGILSIKDSNDYSGAGDENKVGSNG